MTESTASTASALVRKLQTAEPQWLKSWREDGWEAYSSLPSERLEKTDLTNRPWNFGPFPESVSEPVSAKTQALLDSLANSALVFVRDGVVDAVQLPEELRQKGVILTDLATAVAEHEDLVKTHLGSVVAKDETKWAAANAALWHGGAFLYVPRNVQLDAPLHFVYEESEAGNGAFPRVLVIAEENSQFSYVEATITRGELKAGSVHSSVLEIVAKANARVKVVTLSEYAKGPTNYFIRRAQVGKDGLVEWIVGDVGDGFTVGLVESRLAGTGSRSTTRAIGLGTGRQHLDFTASMDHAGRFTESDITLHGIMTQRAASVYRSVTHIEKGASGSGSEQHDRMLLLNSKARADAIPMLLIDENDVQRCGHAASVGQIDPNQIYYLMSRGIPEHVATQMIVWGYLEPTVEEIPTEAMRNLFVQRINEELGK